MERELENVVYIFKHKLKCGYCGMPISSDCGTTKQGKKMNYYKCLGRKRNNGCTKSSVRKETFETFVLDNVLKVLSNTKYIDTIVNSLYQIQETQSNTNSIINSLLKEYKQAENSLNNIMKAVEQGIVNNTTNKRMKELENQIEDIDRQILIEKSKNAFKVSKQALKEFFIEALKLEPKLLIDYVIKEIRVYEDKLEIIFNSPIKRSPDTNQGFFVLSFMKQLLKYAQYTKAFNMIDVEIKVYV